MTSKVRWEARQGGISPTKSWEPNKPWFLRNPAHWFVNPCVVSQLPDVSFLKLLHCSLKCIRSISSWFAMFQMWEISWPNIPANLDQSCQLSQQHIAHVPRVRDLEPPATPCLHGPVSLLSREYLAVHARPLFEGKASRSQSWNFKRLVGDMWHILGPSYILNQILVSLVLRDTLECSILQLSFRFSRQLMKYQLSGANSVEVPPFQKTMDTPNSPPEKTSQCARGPYLIKRSGEGPQENTVNSRHIQKQA